MLPDSTVIRLHGCIPSGWYFTQLIGSIVNMIVTRTLYSLQGIIVNDFRVLGSHSLSFLNRPDFEHLSIDKLESDAKLYFNFELNKKKVKFSTENGTIKFLGYRLNGPLFVKDDLDLFKQVLYVENNILTLD